LLLDLCAIVGRRHLLTGAHDTMRFRRGFRTPAGEVVAVVRPATLVEMWRVLVRLVKSDIAIIIQASNTGLTGGSTPDDRIDRPVVIVSTTRLRAIHLIDGGRQAISLPGATLGELEQRLAPLGREPHSVIGSTCFGASVVGGICNNSGGALIRRGPAFTELALFAQVDEAGRLSLVNRLGVELGDDPEAMLARLESGDFLASPSALRASDTDYEARVRATDEASPARFNSDPRCLHDAAGSAGRIAVFAVRTDSFPRAAPGTTFYIGSNDPGDLTRLRRTMLAAPGALPISAEYIHCDAFDIADHYGRDIFYAIRLLGTRRLPVLNAVKARVDAAGDRIGIAALADRFLHLIGRFLPRHLPQRLRKWRDLYAHHLILKVDAAGVPAAREILRDVFQTSGGGAFECTVDEAEKAMLHRFVVASAAVRYQAVRRHDFAGLVSLDVALPRNAAEWDGAGEEAAPGSIAARLVYGHFFCHVFHRDYLVVPGFDPAEVKAALLASLDAAGGEYPAEHNVGRQYRAKPALEAFYRTLDPTNRFNPGIGLTATGPDWSEPANFGEMA
jgi:D-lactate dehydrogenase